MKTRLACVFLLAFFSCGCSKDQMSTTAPSSTKSFEFTVISQGFSSSGYGGVTFKKNGKTFFSGVGGSTTGCRGFCIVAINPVTGDLIEAKNFDTWYDLHVQSTGVSSAMVDFVNNQAQGTLILLGVGDEAGLTSGICTPSTRQENLYKLLENLGAKTIRGYCAWDSYSLIAFKGQLALTEQLGKGVQVTSNYTLTIP